MSALAVPSPAPPPLTGEEFGRLYSGKRVELIDGQVREVPMPSPKHGKVCNLFAYFLTHHVMQHDCGHVVTNDSFVRVRERPEKIRGCDVGYYSYERLPRGPFPEGVLRVNPNLIAEARSPSDTWSEVFTKILEYLSADVQAVVLLDADSASASVCRLGPVLQQIFRAGDTLTIPEVLPGFALPVARLFD